MKVNPKLRKNMAKERRAIAWSIFRADCDAARFHNSRRRIMKFLRDVPFPGMKTRKRDVELRS